MIFSEEINEDFYPLAKSKVIKEFLEVLYIFFIMKYVKYQFLVCVATVSLFAGCVSSTQQQNQLTKNAEKHRIPMIYSSDLFQPPDDPDDHYDLAMLFSLEEIELKAMIFDLASTRRQKEEVGKNALEQLTKITGHSPVPWKIGLRNPLLSPDDKALDQPQEYQGGVELILSTLEQSEEKVVMFLVGSCRDFVVAFNRNPDLLKRKVKAIYVNAGNGSKGIQTEWNVTLDPYAYAGLMMSGLPIYWCPCFTDTYTICTPEEIAAGKAFYTYYLVPNQAELLASASKPVKNYFGYALYGLREEPLGYLNREPLLLPEGERNMWCTGPFLHAAGREIYQTQNGQWIACTPEKAKTMGITSPPVEVFHFEPVHVKYQMKDVKGKQLPEFLDADHADPTAPVQVFRYTNPDYNAIMASVLAGILETL